MPIYNNQSTRAQHGRVSKTQAADHNGDIFVIKAGEIHGFKVVGDSPLVQLDIHLSPGFIQENL